MEQGAAFKDKALLLETYGITPAGNGTASVKVGSDMYLLCEQKNDRTGATDMVLKKPSDMVKELDTLLASPLMREAVVFYPEQLNQRVYRDAIAAGEKALKATPTYDATKPDDMPANVREAVERFQKGGADLDLAGAGVTGPVQKFGR